MTMYAHLPTIEHHNAGIASQRALALYCGQVQTRQDDVRYNEGSDVVAFGMNISVKATGFTLMSSLLCEGLTDFEDIWNLYATRVHSDHFAYVTEDFDCYMMNLAEFGIFVHTFCRLEKDSAKNGGMVKIRCRHESEKMRKWLRERAI